MTPKIEFRWLKSYTPSEDAIAQSDWGGRCYWTLQFRTHADTGGCDIALSDPWGPWESVKMVEVR
jgi:hypothetical protein